MDCGCFDDAEFRRVLGLFVTGVTIVTTLDAGGKPHGLTANSFTSVSLRPPLLLWCQSRTAPSHAVFRSAPRFAVHILAEDQLDLSNRFAGGAGDKFAGTDWQPGLGGIPLINHCVATLECRRGSTYAGGDHRIFLGEVERFASRPRRALLFGCGQYLLGWPHVMQHPTDHLGPAETRVMGIASRLLAAFAAEHDVAAGIVLWGNHGPTIVRWTETRGNLTGRVRIGTVIPVTTTASGRAFLAYLPGKITEPIVRGELGLEPLRAEGHAAGEVWMRSVVQTTRLRGFASIRNSPSFSELYGGRVSAVAAPVFGPDGEMLMALAAAAPARELPEAREKEVGNRLKHVAASISAILAGGSGP